MKNNYIKTIIGMIILTIVISNVSAVTISMNSGESKIIDFSNEFYSLNGSYSITGNSLNLDGVNIYFDGIKVNITLDIGYAPDTWDLTVYGLTKQEVVDSPVYKGSSGGFWWITHVRNNASSPYNISHSPIINIVGNDSDIYGCKASAGYSWCEVKNKCIRSWEENCTNVIDINNTGIDKPSNPLNIWKIIIGILIVVGVGFIGIWIYKLLLNSTEQELDIGSYENQNS